MSENNYKHHHQNNAHTEIKHESKPDSNFSKPIHEEKSEKVENHNEITLLKDQISNYEKQLADLKDGLIRAVAEAENQKKRHMKDLEATAKFGVTGILKEIIDPFEQLFIALSISVPQNLQEDDVFKSIFSGLEMTRNLFEKALAKHGLERIYPKGEKFNHDTQQAISQIPQEGIESGTVVDVVQAGYVLHGRVIKPALVVVAG